MCRDPGSIPGQGTKISQAVSHDQRKKLKKENSKPLAFHLPLLDVHHTHPHPHICLGQILLSSPRDCPAVSSSCHLLCIWLTAMEKPRQPPGPTWSLSHSDTSGGPWTTGLSSFGWCMVSSSYAPLLCYPSPSLLPLSHFISTNFGLNLVPEASLPFTLLASMGMGSAQNISSWIVKKKNAVFSEQIEGPLFFSISHNANIALYFPSAPDLRYGVHTRPQICWG